MAHGQYFSSVSQSDDFCKRNLGHSPGKTPENVLRGIMEGLKMKSAIVLNYPNYGSRYSLFIYICVIF